MQDICYKACICKGGTYIRIDLDDLMRSCRGCVVGIASPGAYILCTYSYRGTWYIQTAPVRTYVYAPKRPGRGYGAANSIRRAQSLQQKANAHYNSH